jgi:hypothetical protein
MIRLLPSHPPPPLPTGKFDRQHTGRPRKKDHSLTKKEGKWGRGEEPNHGEKIRSSINHSKLSGKEVSILPLPIDP